VTNAGSTPRMPVSVLRRIGNSAYKLRARAAVCSPIPMSGSRKPNSAGLGIQALLAVALPAAAIALLAHAGLELIERRLSPA
jgi:hypothetical protein